MRLAKRLLLQLYYHSTRPLRWWQQRRMLETRGVPIAVLFYHRVADDEACEWTISNQTFVEQVRWLREHVELISLAEVQRRVRSGSNDRPAVAITFDDGYADNCQQAIPFLVEQGVPCTYFVTLYNVLAGQPFAHDLLCENYFAPNTKNWPNWSIARCAISRFLSAGAKISIRRSSRCCAGRAMRACARPMGGSIFPAMTPFIFSASGRQTA